MEKIIRKTLKTFCTILILITGFLFISCPGSTGKPLEEEDDALALFLCENLCNSGDENVKLCFYSDGSVKLRATSLNDNNDRYGKRYDKLRGTYTGDPSQSSGNLVISIKEKGEWEPYAGKESYSSIEEAMADIHWKVVYKDCDEEDWQAEIAGDILTFSNGKYQYDDSGFTYPYEFRRTTADDLGPYRYAGVTRRKSKNKLTSWTIPEGYTSVGKHCFNPAVTDEEEFQYLEKVILPSGIRKIGENAFKNCTSLKDIAIPEGCIEIGEGAFCDCSSLETITLPSTIEKIGACAFAKAIEESASEDEEVSKNILVLSFAQGITKIPDSSFNAAYRNYITELKSVVIPSSVKVIGQKAFYQLNPQVTVNIPEGVEEIQEAAFASSYSGALKLQRLLLPSTIKKIGKEAFEYNQLEKIEIPEGTEEIQEYAFNQVYGESEKPLKELTLPSTLQTLYASSFSTDKLQLLKYNGSVGFLVSMYSKCNLSRNTGIKIIYNDYDVSDYFVGNNANSKLVGKKWINEEKDMHLSLEADKTYSLITGSQKEKGLWTIDDSAQPWKLAFYNKELGERKYVYDVSGYNLNIQELANFKRDEEN